jgi:hypothetical protein
MTDNLVRPPFTRVRLDEEREKDKGIQITVWLNEEEQLILSNARRLLHQPKNATALKMLAVIGANILNDPKTRQILEYVWKNLEKNKRTGISIIE